MSGNTVNIELVRKGEEQTSSMIFIVGFIALVAVFVSAAFIGIDSIRSPQSSVQVAEGDRDQVSAHLGDLADRCWEEGGEGTSSQVIDCFEVTVLADEEVREEHVTQEVQSLDDDQFTLEEPLPAGEIEVKVRYENGEVKISLFQIVDDHEPIDDGDGDTPGGDGDEPGSDLISAEREAFKATMAESKDLASDVSDEVPSVQFAFLDQEETTQLGILDTMAVLEQSPKDAEGVDGSKDQCSIIEQQHQQLHDLMDQAKDRIKTNFDQKRDQIKSQNLDPAKEQELLNKVDQAEQKALDGLNQCTSIAHQHFDNLNDKFGCDGIDHSNSEMIDDEKAAFQSTIDAAKADVSGVAEEVPEINDFSELDTILSTQEDILNQAVAARPAPLQTQANQNQCDAIEKKHQQLHDLMDQLRNETKDHFDQKRDKINNSNLPEDKKKNLLDQLDQAEQKVLDGLNQCTSILHQHFDKLNDQFGCGGSPSHTNAAAIEDEISRFQDSLDQADQLVSDIPAEVPDISGFGLISGVQTGEEQILRRAAAVGSTPPAQGQNKCDQIEQKHDELHKQMDELRNKTKKDFDQKRDQIKNAGLPSDKEQNILDSLDQAEQQALDALNKCTDVVHDHFNKLADQHSCSVNLHS